MGGQEKPTWDLCSLSLGSFARGGPSSFFSFFLCQSLDSSKELHSSPSGDGLTEPGSLSGFSVAEASKGRPPTPHRQPTKEGFFSRPSTTHAVAVYILNFSDRRPRESKLVPRRGH